MRQFRNEPRFDQLGALLSGHGDWMVNERLSISDRKFSELATNLQRWKNLMVEKVTEGSRSPVGIFDLEIASIRKLLERHITAIVHDDKGHRIDVVGMDRFENLIADFAVELCHDESIITDRTDFGAIVQASLAKSPVK